MNQMTPTQTPERKHKVAVSMIVGNDYTDEKWERVVKSIEPYVDGIYVNYNGTEEVELSYRPTSVEFVWKHFIWKEDFSDARNNAMKMIPMEDYDWWLWIDLDDEAIHFDKLDNLLSNLHRDTQVVMLRYDYATDTSLDVASAVQDRERIFKTDLKGKWHYPIHELFRMPMGVQIAKKVTQDDPAIKHYKQEGFVDGKDDGTRERNKSIIINALKTDPYNERLRFYLANEIYAQAALAKNDPEIGNAEANNLCDVAIKAYETYLQLNPPIDEAYITTHQIAEIYRMKQQFLEAIEVELQATMLHADWPDAWLGIAHSYLYLGDWDKAIFYASICRELTEEPNTPVLREPLNTQYLPTSIIATAYEEKGETAKALDFFYELAEVSKDVHLKNKIAELEEKLETPEVIGPDIRHLNWGKNEEKSIAFFCRPSVEEWSSKSMNEGGIGGTETAVCEIAKRFAENGWRTAIFASPPEDIRNTVYDGIEWYESTAISITEPWNTIVSVRTPELFDTDFNCENKVLWMHDVNTGDNFIDEDGNSRADKIDYIIGVSDWHCRHMSRLYEVSPDRFFTIRNGINLERFQDRNIEKNPYKFIWPSSPDRGLDVVLEMWPDIKEIIPEAELHIFYGWDNYDKAVAVTQNQYMIMYKNKVMKLLEYMEENDLNVVWRGRIGQQELADEFLSASYLPYFGEFLETNWISGIEAQAANCVPIISNIGGAPENLSTAGFQIQGFPKNFAYRKQALAVIKELSLRTEDNIRWDNKIMQTFSEKYTWDNSFKGWQQIVKESKKELAEV